MLFKCISVVEYHFPNASLRSYKNSIFPLCVLNCPFPSEPKLNKAKVLLMFPYGFQCWGRPIPVSAGRRYCIPRSQRSSPGTVSCTCASLAGHTGWASSPNHCSAPRGPQKLSLCGNFMPISPGVGAERVQACFPRFRYS